MRAAAHTSRLASASRAGARIVAPLATGLIALEVTGPDQACGRFLAPGGFFMFLRGTNQQDKPPAPAHGTRRDPRPTELGPRQTFYEDHLRFLLTVALPDVSTGQHGPAWEDLTISDSAGSTARLDRADNGAFLVTETGPRHLWKEHLHQWQAWGKPHRERYGLTVNGESQTIWLDEPPDGPNWLLPSQITR